ncbi:DNA recombination protein RmuC [Leptospira perolatii]|uniref:DNA recombination protein RmuC n=1 Tax=Leptospira perolatii TaxID=2023191 RepID=A0A2M9ZNJ1_9LEPT|nr:DNA recombination protein RmuC [Leptospira perolatii]PJZ69598.1 DNA recombination protein RmuC [Leptospira perolatii]PJZ73585.1 DNA recombination protein RmuC [Leptospira perolatii]
MEYAITIMIGAAIGFLAAFFVAKKLYTRDSDISPSDHEKLKLDHASTLAREKEAKQRVGQLESELKISSEKNLQAIGQYQSMKKESDLLKERLESQKKEFEELTGKLKDEFKNLANQVLLDNSQKFNQQTQEKLNDLLKPFKDEIEKFGTTVEKSHKEQKDDTANLKAQINNLLDMNKTLSEDAKSLAAALKGNSKTQGDWGEGILENILQNSGLVKGREYVAQDSVQTEDGRLRPDIVVKLPSGKSIVIDSKVSLTAYVEFASSDSEEIKKAALQRHLKSLYEHVASLFKKNYQSLYGIESLDFVLMFLPVEPSYYEAVRFDPKFLEEAYSKNILVVTPSTLMVSLKMVANLWRKEKQNKNAETIAEESGKMYDKIVEILAALENLGKSIDNSRKHYDSVLGKLKSGRGNLLTRAENMRKLGAKVRKSLEGIGGETEENESEEEEPYLLNGE